MVITGYTGYILLIGVYNTLNANLLSPALFWGLIIGDTNYDPLRA